MGDVLISSMEQREKDWAERARKLPQWAQDYIATLRGRLDNVEKDLKRAEQLATTFAASLSGGSEFTVNVDDVTYPVGKDATVDVKLPAGQLELSVAENRLVIEGISGAPVVRALYANRLAITLEEW